MAQLRTLGELFTYEAVGEGSTVVTQGEPAETFYIVINGSVDVFRDMGKLRHRLSVDPDTLGPPPSPEDEQNETNKANAIIQPP